MAGRLLAGADRVEHNTGRLRAVAANSGNLRLEGGYAAPFLQVLTELPDELAKLGVAYRGCGDALSTYAVDLEQAKSTATTALNRGTDAHLRVQGAQRQIRSLVPADLYQLATPQVYGSAARAEALLSRIEDEGVRANVRQAVQRARYAQADQAQAVALANRAADLHQRARTRCTVAINQALDSSGVKNLSWWQKAWDFTTDSLRFLGFLPTDNQPVHIANWMFGLGGLAFGAGVSAMVTTRYGRFQPRLNGRFASPAGLDFWGRFKAGLTPSKSWHANPYQAAIRGKWETAGKWGSRVGVVITAGVAAWDQWEADSHDPSLDTAAKVGRATTQGAVTAAGAWAGAEAGAWLGGAIGTAICPGVGTVIGGVVGGLVGGAIGAWGGGQLGNVLVDPIGKATDAAADWIGDKAGDLADSIGDGLSHLKFW